MRAILVDDERLALKKLKNMLECDVGGVEVVGICSDPGYAVQMVADHQPDVVFLDIHMPEMDGLALGERIQAEVPHVELVFVTGYDHHAVEAFKLYALDYLLKPVQSGRLQMTVQRLLSKKRINTAPVQEPVVQQPMICCYKQVRFQFPGTEPQQIKWRTSKAQELFSYLLCHRGRSIERNELMELLWPGFEEAKAAQQLYTTIYHIRQTLKRNGLEQVSLYSGNLDAGYRLVLGEVRVDVEEWERQVEALEVPSLPTIAEHERVLSLYEGDYLGDHNYGWAEQERGRLQQIWHQHARNVSKFYIEQGDMEAAIRINHRIQQLLPDAEDSYYQLMQLYDAVNNRGGVEEQYNLLVVRMAQKPESVIDPGITEWYYRWRREDIALQPM
ncbi:response regulator [Paenibacillus sp. GCM10027626]|uniref:response regulator n=1 Tax=Paenibacillus sp. GCM10027626 TaxID=3273411 RepID=UPI00363A0940